MKEYFYALLKFTIEVMHGENTQYIHDILKSAHERKFWVVVLLSPMKDHLIPRRMQFTASRYLFSFQSYKDLHIPNQRDIEKGLDQKASFVKFKEVPLFAVLTRETYPQTFSPEFYQPTLIRWLSLLYVYK